MIYFLSNEHARYKEAIAKEEDRAKELRDIEESKKRN
jgi:hypothetical protein